MSEARAVASRAEVVTVADLVDALGTILAGGESDDPVADAREIVAALHDVPRFWPRLNPAVPVGTTLPQRAMAAAALRARGAPLAYAVGRAHFRHLTLDVDPRVLIPRPETEQLVDLVLAESAAHALPGEALVVDVGTGSGAIALAVATEGPFARVIGTDISLDALEVARRNASRLAGHGGARVELLHGSLLQPVRAAGERAHVVVSNPPYIADGEAPSLPRSVRDWEPAVALYSGHDGLSATRRLVAEAVEVLMPGGLLAMEVDARRASLAAELVASESRFHAVRVILDFSGRERFVLARLREGGGE